MREKLNWRFCGFCDQYQLAIQLKFLIFLTWCDWKRAETFAFDWKPTRAVELQWILSNSFSCSRKHLSFFELLKRNIMDCPNSSLISWKSPKNSSPLIKQLPTVIPIFGQRFNSFHCIIKSDLSSSELIIYATCLPFRQWRREKHSSRAKSERLGRLLSIQLFLFFFYWFKLVPIPFRFYSQLCHKVKSQKTQSREFFFGRALFCFYFLFLTMLFGSFLLARRRSNVIWSEGDLLWKKSQTMKVNKLA